MENREENINALKKLRVTMITKSLLIFLGIIFMQLIALAILSGLSFVIPVQKADYVLMISAISAILSFVWCAVLYNKSSWRDKNTDYRKVFSAKNLILILCIGSGCCILITFLLSALTSAMPKVFEDYTKLMSNFEKGNMAITLAYTIFIGPVSEEMIFRGAIFDRVYIAFDFWIANLLQAALFGIYHMNIIQGLYAFVLGIVLGIIVKATGSIFCSMLTHIIFNTTSYLMPILLGTGVAALNITFMILFVMLVIAGIFGIKILVQTLS